jgi:hypothetical protein
MFLNRFRKYAFGIWAVAIPTALIGALLRGLDIGAPGATIMIAGGIAASIMGLIILKFGGRAHV